MLSIFSRKPQLVTNLEWLGTDIHSHLLPGIDDGSPDVATSISLINGLSALGLTKFICTPHIFKELYPNNSTTVGNALALLKEGLSKVNANVEISAGAEYMIDGDFEENNDLLCLADKYLLIEMSYLNEAPNIEQVIFNLQIRGYIIVLAHPERYNFYHKERSRYQRLKDMGCLFQLNLLSLTGYYGKEVKLVTDYLLEKKMYDLAGTDLHHQKHLGALTKAVQSGLLYQAISKYSFQNKELFG
jgi:protein-tyrosine phosphatase